MKVYHLIKRRKGNPEIESSEITIREITVIVQREELERGIRKGILIRTGILVSLVSILTTSIIITVREEGHLPHQEVKEVEADLKEAMTDINVITSTRRMIGGNVSIMIIRGRGIIVILHHHHPHHNLLSLLKSLKDLREVAVLEVDEK